MKLCRRLSGFTTYLWIVAILSWEINAQARQESSIAAAFQTSYYLQDPLENSSLTQNAFSSVNLSIQAQKTWPETQLSIESMGAIGLNCKSCTFFEISQAYFSYSADDQNGISFGRKKEVWSYLDSYWHLGLWQPRFVQDELRPIESGLTGFHFDLKPSPGFQFTALISPLSIPERGTQLSFRNDRLIRGDSPWFIQPPQKVSIMGQDTEIDYRLSDIDERQILFNPTVAFQVTHGDPRGTFWTKMGYAFKPKNQMGAYFQPYLRLDSFRAQVDIFPEIQFTHNFGIESGGHYGSSEYWVSAQGVRYLDPNRKGRPAGGFGDAVTGNVYLFGLYAAQKLKWIKFLQHSQVALGWLHQWNRTTLFDLNKGVNFSSQAKQGYSSAVKAALDLPVGGLWHFSSTYTVGLQSSDSVFSLAANYVQTDNLTVSLLVDFLSGTSRPESSMWGRFRGNDRVIGSFSYVF
jgi:hypothetical protein